MQSNKEIQVDHKLAQASASQLIDVQLRSLKVLIHPGHLELEQVELGQLVFVISKSRSQFRRYEKLGNEFSAG